jgi:hypothetical protein
MPRLDVLDEEFGVAATQTGERLLMLASPDLAIVSKPCLFHLATVVK